MTLLPNEIIIDGILYNTKNENDRRFIGLYEENKLLKYFINNNIKKYVIYHSGWKKSSADQ